jgi:hypothetical protein
MIFGSPIKKKLLLEGVSLVDYVQYTGLKKQDYGIDLYHLPKTRAVEDYPKHSKIWSNPKKGFIAH